MILNAGLFFVCALNFGRSSPLPSPVVDSYKLPPFSSYEMEIHVA